MKFLRQTKLEIRNIVKSVFILVIGIIVLATSVVIPCIAFGVKLRNEALSGNDGPTPYYGRVYAEKIAYSYGGMPYMDGGEGEPVTVDGVTITQDNPYYWNIFSDMQEKTSVSADANRFSTPEATDLYLAMLDEEIHFYAKIAQYITTYNDYRTQLAWNGLQDLYEKFIYEHLDANTDALVEAVSSRKGIDPDTFKKKYVDSTAEERQAAYVKAGEAVDTLYEVVENNDFDKFIALSIEQQNEQIASLEENIALQQKLIIDNPSQEDIINRTIEDLQKQIDFIKDNSIPILEFRLEKHIVPGENVWQNTAIQDIEENRNQLLYNTVMDEDQFNQDPGMKMQYGNYAKYKAQMQKQRDGYTNAILIAQNSLDAGKPDMKYVPDAARNQTAGFLYFSAFVAIFGVMLGGWLMASEYQQGTIRLLMIRPKKRLKILMAKFTAAFIVCLVIYAAGALLNGILNGAFNGFSDFAFPNYTITGEVSFFAYYLPKFAMCIVTILLGFTSAFMLSVLTKNTAVSIVVPSVCYIGSLIFTVYFAFSTMMKWAVYTPIPYVQLSILLGANDRSSFLYYAMQNGLNFNLPLGIGMLLGLSVVFTGVAMLVFHRRDITN
jgi:ABC-2 type transport system permease protein